MRAWGASEEDIERFLQTVDEAEPETCWILPENWPSLRVFLACNNKWKVDSMNGRVRGLDFAQAEVAMRAYRIRLADREAVFDDLLAMERAALPLLNRGA